MALWLATSIYQATSESCFLSFFSKYPVSFFWSTICHSIGGAPGHQTSVVQAEARAEAEWLTPQWMTAFPQWRWYQMHASVQRTPMRSYLQASRWMTNCKNKPYRMDSRFLISERRAVGGISEGCEALTLYGFTELLTYSSFVTEPDKFLVTPMLQARLRNQDRRGTSTSVFDTSKAWDTSILWFTRTE